MIREKVPQSDDLPYRDYLVGVEEVFTYSPPSEFETPLSKNQIRQQTLQKLKVKFKQDFSTNNNEIISANKIPIEVMLAVLTEDLGFNPNNIPDQNTLSDRIYLDDLIALSNQTLEVLMTKYRIDLTRPDLEKTTRVRENILTLQSHLRDDKFEKPYNPFFLYKDEWRLQFKTPFFPENIYAFKRGLFAKSEDRSRAMELVSTIENHKEYTGENELYLKGFVDRIKILFINPQSNLDYNLTEGHRQFLAEEYGIAMVHYKKASSNIRELAGKMQIQAWSYSEDGVYSTYFCWTPSLGNAESFIADLDPATAVSLHGPTHKLFFASHPHKPSWETGKKQGYWDPIDTTSWDPVKLNIPKKKIPKKFPFTVILFDRLKWRYSTRAKMKVNSIKNLEDLEERNLVTVNIPSKAASQSATYKTFLVSASYEDLKEALLELHDDLISLVPHVMFCLLPICQADVAVALGDFPTAAKIYAQVVKEHLLRGSLTKDSPLIPSEANGDLPWSWTKDVIAVFKYGKDYPYLNKDCECPFLLLRLGKLYLTWADKLYRTDQEPEVYRARELYKSVLKQYGISPLSGTGLSPLSMETVNRPTTIYEASKTRMKWRDIHGQEPLIPKSNPKVPERGRPNNPGLASSAKSAKEAFAMAPASKAAWAPFITAKVSPQAFAEPDTFFAAPFIGGGFVIFTEVIPINPAILAQQTRASTGITQIDAGLNYYGYAHDLVPIFRYNILVSAAKHFTNLAKRAESDFLSYKECAEKAEIGLIQAYGAVSNAALRVQIESQRILQAEDYVKQAEIQVQQVKDVIKAKKAQIADSNSLWSQFSDFFGGIADFFTGVPGKATSYIGSDFSTAFGFGGATTGAVAGLGVVGGMALFGVAGVVTMKGMADAANNRVSELQKLQTQQLPMAEAALKARQREVTIAQFQKAVATLEALTAQSVLRYSLYRTLNKELWNQMATAMKSVICRYIDLGAMTGWLAERALSYAQDRDIRLIHFDYFDLERHGILAADMLQEDISSLESEYITGLQQTVPIKWTVSLARDFPLQFGQLKITGRCEFMTSSKPLNLTYPGSFNHRIRAVEVTAILPITEPPPRGQLTNPGISQLEGPTLGDSHIWVRPPDILPLSEFTLKDDMAIYEIPGKTLMPFEGSGIDTFWILELPAVGNPMGLRALADICITFSLQVRFSSSRKTKLVEIGPTEMTRFAIFSAKSLFPELLKTFLTTVEEENLEFAIIESLLPAIEKDRKVMNIAIFFLGKDLPEITGTLKSTDVPTSIEFTTKKGLAYSNNLPQQITTISTPPAALNPLATGKPEQNWTLTVPVAKNQSLDCNKIDDIILGIEYTTKLDFKMN